MEKKFKKLIVTELLAEYDEMEEEDRTKKENEMEKLQNPLDG